MPTDGKPRASRYWAHKPEKLYTFIYFSKCDNDLSVCIDENIQNVLQICGYRGDFEAMNLFFEKYNDKVDYCKLCLLYGAIEANNIKFINLIIDKNMNFNRFPKNMIKEFNECNPDIDYTEVTKLLIIHGANHIRLGLTDEHVMQIFDGDDCMIEKCLNKTYRCEISAIICF